MNPSNIEKCISKSIVTILLLAHFSLNIYGQNFQVEKLSPVINSSNYDEISPVVSTDGKELYFTRVKHPEYDRTLIWNGQDISLSEDILEYERVLKKVYSEITGQEVYDPITSPFNQDVWIAKSSADADFVKVIHPPYPMNNALPNSVCAVTQDPNTFVVVNKFGQDGSMEGGFSFIDRETDTKWHFPRPIDIKDFYSLGADVSLNMSPDGEVVVLSLSRYDSYGDNDLYVSFRIDSTHFSEPQNLGSQVNTYFREITPFLSLDRKSLYFSSNRKGTIGGNDIFIAERLDDTWKNWTSPKRFIEPINSKSDDSQPYFNAATGYVYFSSKRDGSSDLFRAKIAEPSNDEVTLVGKVTNPKTSNPINAKILVTIPTKSWYVKTYFTEENGDFRITVPKGETVEITPVVSGYSGKASVQKFEKNYYYFKEYDLQLEAQPLEKGMKVNLEPIYFEQSKAIIRSISYSELDKLVKFLNDNKNVYILIEGHTDNNGKEPELLALSEDRAYAIKEYLILQDIHPIRIETKGFGSSKPISTNGTEEDRAKNRRVEFIILESNNLESSSTEAR
jgi:outer membrane protein OmpA-like peptidoglycan-associated protein